MAIALLHESTSDEPPFTLDDAVESESARQDRRAEVRLSAEDASWLRGARLKYGAEVRVIDISTWRHSLRVRRRRPSRLAAASSSSCRPRAAPILVPARVLRSQSIEERTMPRYQTACEFKRPLSIDTLAAVAKTAGSERRRDSPRSPASRCPWQRVVARFRNGHMVRGYTNDFHPSKPHLHLTPEDRAGEPIFVTARRN